MTSVTAVVGEEYNVLLYKGCNYTYIISCSGLYYYHYNWHSDMLLSEYINCVKSVDTVYTS